MKPILLILFKFPPYSGVGGFRWVKMAKYLARLGRELHVVTVPWEGGGPVALSEDSISPRIHVHRIDSGFPHNELHYTGDDPKCLDRRAQALERMHALGIFDEAGAWGKTLLPYCRDLIAEHGIRVAVATGHPFHANLWAAEFKEQTPGLLLIQDFRDLISSIRVNTRATQQDCLDMQQRCVDAADLVTAISPGMVEILEQETPSDKYRTLYNGFDPERLVGLRKGKGRDDSGPLTFCYLGSLGGGRHLVMETFLTAVEALVGNGARLRVRLAGDNHGYIAKKFAHLTCDGVLEPQPSLPHDQAMELAADCDFGLNLLAPDMGHYLPTKIYDYMGLGLPCLSLGPAGDSSRLLERCNCGLALEADAAVIQAALSRLCGERLEFSFAGAAEFGMDRIARRFNDLVVELSGEAHG